MTASEIYVILDPEVHGTFLHKGEIPEDTKFFHPQRPYQFPFDYEILELGHGSTRFLDLQDYLTFGATGALLTLPIIIQCCSYSDWKKMI